MLFRKKFRKDEDSNITNRWDFSLTFLFDFHRLCIFLCCSRSSSLLWCFSSFLYTLTLISLVTCFSSLNMFYFSFLAYDRECPSRNVCVSWSLEARHAMISTAFRRYRSEASNDTNISFFNSFIRGLTSRTHQNYVENYSFSTHVQLSSSNQMSRSCHWS